MQGPVRVGERGVCVCVCVCFVCVCVCVSYGSTSRYIRDTEYDKIKNKIVQPQSQFVREKKLSAASLFYENYKTQ